MAEGAITFAFQKLRDGLIQGALRLYGVEDQANWVAEELQRIQCFIEDAEDRQNNGDERAKSWLREITDVAHRAEDVIDWIVEVEGRRRQRRLEGSIKRYVPTLPLRMIARHKLVVEIANIRTRIVEISNRQAIYGIVNISETGGNDIESRRRVTADLHNEDVVGFGAYCEHIVSKLLDTHDKRRYCLSIVGMGGVGKTTLAKMVYNRHEIKASFSTRVWITVPFHFKGGDIINTIASMAMGTTKHDLETLEVDEVKDKLEEFLKATKYFIVMDDVWEADVWEKVSAFLPDVGNGSRVLFTTRVAKVAKSADPITPPLMLPLLTDCESWELFTRIAVPTGSFPRELEELARSMVAGCAGLPLALRVLGGILSTKPPTLLTWMGVQSQIWDSRYVQDNVMKIIALSYKNLPHHRLRSCFLCVSFFPDDSLEDSLISASELARLWIAEGFIPQNDQQSMDDTASGYLDELVNRSLIQDVARRTDGRVSKFRIHDLMRDMCLVKAEQDRFLTIIHGSNNFSGNLERGISTSRRLSVDNLTSDDCNRMFPPSNLRSLFLRSQLLVHGKLKILRGMTLLRVLDLSGLTNLSRFPEEIKLMPHLTYLKFGDISLEKLPSSMGMLRNLQTLDLKNARPISKLPKQVGEIPSLQHLFINMEMNTYCPPFTRTRSIQTLKWVRADQSWCEESLPSLTNLQRLAIHATGSGTVVFDSLGKLERLSSLSLTSYDFPVGPAATELSSCPRVTKLFLSGRWGRWPTLTEIDRFSQNLTKLTLERSGLEQDPMPVLEKLSKLVCLELGRASYHGKKIVCTTNGFPRLEELILSEMDRLKDWIMEEGAFPQLTRLLISFLPKLAMLPEALRYVTSLKEVKVYDSLRNRLSPDVGEDWYKIMHAPSIIQEIEPENIYADSDDDDDLAAGLVRHLSRLNSLRRMRGKRC